MPYQVKETFYTLQGEGAKAGRPAVFCRFAGCNLWSGRETDRNTAICRFCDTDFVGTDGEGGGYFADSNILASHIDGIWGQRQGTPYVVCTGGEPLLQVNSALIDDLHGAGFEVAVETNGTIEAPANLDWICVSPKGNTALKQNYGHELKLVYPQPEAPPERFVDMDFRHFYLQPMDGPDLADNTAATLDYCLAHPHWRLSLQIHKILSIP